MIAQPELRDLPQEIVCPYSNIPLGGSGCVLPSTGSQKTKKKKKKKGKIQLGDFLPFPLNKTARAPITNPHRKPAPQCGHGPEAVWVTTENIFPCQSTFSQEKVVGFRSSKFYFCHFCLVLRARSSLMPRSLDWLLQGILLSPLITRTGLGDLMVLTLRCQSHQKGRKLRRAFRAQGLMSNQTVGWRVRLCF